MLPESASKEKDEEARWKLEELLNIDSGIDEWDLDFIESLSHWDGMFTVKQADKIIEKWGKYLF